METPSYYLPSVVQTKSEAMEDFQGPLDVIFLLLSKHKIEISNVSISQILEQYLAYLDEQKRMDMEIASEFIAMASHLMLIKTKMLLSVTEQAEAQSEMELLIHSLEERQRAAAYEQVRMAASFLAERNEIGCNLFVKEPEPLRRDKTYQYRHDPSDLVAAWTALAERSAAGLASPTHPFAAIVGAEPFPVVTKAAHILRRLLQVGVGKFRSLFRGCKSRSEVVATFLAVLELCKLCSVRVVSDGGGDADVTFLQMPQGTVDGQPFGSSEE